MFKFQVRSYQLPGWIVPLLALAALALIPFALMLALGLGVLAIGGTLLRALFLPPVNRYESVESENRKPSKLGSGPTDVIDADYEIKGENEKSERR
jgi:hypothetical protein